jgi:hypothetical protein
MYQHVFTNSSSSIYFIAVPPDGFVHAHFDARIHENLDLYVLFDNCNPCTGDGVVFETLQRANESVAAVSPCAKVSQFINLRIFKLGCLDCNVLLKYQGFGNLSSRRGNNMGRVGFMGWVVGKQSADDKLDFATNTMDIELVFST